MSTLPFLDLPPIYLAFLVACVLGTFLILARTRAADRCAEWCTLGDSERERRFSEIEPLRDGEVLEVIPGAPPS